MAFKKLKKNIRHGRLGQWLRVNLRLTRRKIRRFFHSPAFRRAVMGKYAKNTYIALIAGAICVGCLITAHMVLRQQNMEAKILQRLTYGEDYDTSVPYFRTLHAIGSSNHLCVTVKTAAINNLKDPDVALENGGINLKILFDDGSNAELPLKRSWKRNSFAAGSESRFYLTLPYGYTPFDIASTALVLTPGADGSYDDWLCERANVSFMLGGKRILIAQSSWSDPKRLGSGNNMVRSADLSDARTNNSTYKQMSLLFEELLTLSENGLTDFADSALKQSTMESLGLSNANALYLDVETVSAERNTQIKAALGENSTLPESEDLNYNGVLSVTLTFNCVLKDGGYTKEYLLDIPGKDDFEMSSSSTFRMDLPEGACVFDINNVSITLADLSDAWAPRFVRLYLTLDYDQELEIARLTDKSLELQYDTAVFYRGFLDSPVSFDLSAQNAIPAGRADWIEETYNHKLGAAAHTMYFDKQSYYSRQIRFFEQMNKMHTPQEEKK
ncbi:MAG: hypothetical protein IJN42_05925 [Clostridia bacterium]|nr:hypothetical protein [Clostridia bacterium]